MKIFLDANILFSAANESSNLRRLILKLSKQETLLTSQYAEQVAVRNIQLKRPQWMDGFHSLIQRVQIVPGIDRPVPVEIADKDRPILASAIAESCYILLTGDKRDFGHLFNQKFGTLTVMTPLTLGKSYTAHR